MEDSRHVGVLSDLRDQIASLYGVCKSTLTIVVVVLNRTKWYISVGYINA